MADWKEFEQRKPEAAAQSEPDRDRYSELCAAVFTSGSGAELLKMMKQRTIERRSGHAAPEAVLREHEAVRSFVASLERARDDGHKIAAEKAKPKS